VSESRYNVYIDECGTSQLEISLSNVGAYYVLAAVVVPIAMEAELVERLSVVRRRHFQTGEMKSKNIASATGRRLRVLEALEVAGVKAFVFAVDKRRIDPASGLMYKQPFLKYLQRQVQKRVLTVLERLVRAGEVRRGATLTLGDTGLVRRTPDAALATTQPTLAHHLHALVLHEGYHAGQLATWRKLHGFPPVRWCLAPVGV
jgi:hypothetical protein